MYQFIRPSYLKRAFAGAALAIAILGLCAPHAANAQYSIDDGTAEDSVGAGAGTIIIFNSFATLAGQNTIAAISIAWGTPAFPDPTLNGLSYTAVLWSDPNGDGLPADAVVLATSPGVIALQGTNTFLTSLIAPTTVLTPNFFVGFIITEGANQFPAAFDETAPTLGNRSFAQVGGTINNLSTAGAIEVITGGQLVGNWLIRATAIPEPSTYALIGLGLAGIGLLRRRAARAVR